MPNGSEYIDVDQVGNIDTGNYLKIDFRKRSKQYDFPGFADALSELWKTGRAIERVLNDGFSTERISNLNNFYFEAVKWLKGQEQTSNWVVLPPLGSNQPNEQNDIQQFIQSWIPNYLNNIFSNALLTNYYISAKKSRATREAKSLEDIAAELAATLKEEISSAAFTSKSELEEFASTQISEYKKAVAIQKWQEFYSSLSQPVQKPWYRTLSKGKFTSDHSYYELMEHYGLWRNVWLICFVVGILLSVWVSHALGWTIKNNLAEIVSVKFGVAILFGSLYVSTNKNYRIYSNQYDQTRQRDITAKTIQGIMLDERFGVEEKRILLAVAAQTLFELKPNGHLTKKESSSPVNELLVSILGRQA